MAAHRASSMSSESNCTANPATEVLSAISPTGPKQPSGGPTTGSVRRILPSQSDAGGPLDTMASRASKYSGVEQYVERLTEGPAPRHPSLVPRVLVPVTIAAKRDEIVVEGGGSGGWGLEQAAKHRKVTRIFHRGRVSVSVQGEMSHRSSGSLVLAQARCDSLRIR